MTTTHLPGTDLVDVPDDAYELLHGFEAALFTFQLHRRCFLLFDSSTSVYHGLMETYERRM